MAHIPLLILFSLTHLVLLSSAEAKRHNSRCPQFPCGDLGPLKFPFNNITNPECGVFTVNCSEHIQKIQLKEGGHWYQIENISQVDSVVIRDRVPPFELDSHHCEFIKNFSIPYSSLFSYIFIGKSVTLYNCSHSPVITPRGDFNRTSCGDYDIYYHHLNNSFPLEKQCSIIQLPLPNPEYHHQHTPSKERSFSTYFTFEVHVSRECYRCHYGEGKCEINSENQFHCSNKKGKRRKHVFKVAIVAIAVGMGILMIMMIMLFCCLGKILKILRKILSNYQNPTHQCIEAFLRNCGQVRRYSSLDVKKMTNSFKEKLGQGGFGSVYKGKLDDGCLVAVKVLNESKANGEEFMNEVATISRTSHVNIVSLLGFSFEGSKKALIYEYMPNGSLEKFVFDENETEKSYQLNWQTRYQISLGIARGLEYLHRGCSTRILHFDIKPHNILLNADFVPKISDFGLAKICTREESLVSMLGPRGTVGYIAPEIFSRNFGGVSHKSDVYSYGMMVLEIVGGRKNVNVKVDNTSEVYFPHWIYKRLELDEEFGMKRIMNREDKEKVKKMIIVSLWCIQTDPLHRPAMSKVIEMLEGSLDSLQVPPKPFLSSPSRSTLEECSITCVSLQI